MDPDPYLNQILFNAVSNFILLSYSELSLIIILVILLISLGLFSALQSAFFAVNHEDIEPSSFKNSLAVQSFQYLKSRQRQFTTLILACNTMVVIGICYVVDILFKKWAPDTVFINISEWLLRLFGYYGKGFSLEPTLSFLCVICCATALILLFGKWMPLFFQFIQPQKLSLMFSFPMKQLYWLFSPLTYTMVALTNKAQEVLSKHKLAVQSTTKEDLDTAIDLALTNDSGSEKQANILRGIINFNDVSSKQVMTPRTEIYGLDIQMTYPEVIKTVKECGFSRLPVYEEDFDQILGILYAKDLIAHLHENPQFEWQKLIRTDVLFVPESKKINELLDDFREQHKHMAFVVDEYGGTNGLITLEDIMEEIVGEIRDEFDDQQDLNYIKLDDHNFLFEGKTLINDLCRILGLEVERFEKARGNADSIAGLFLEHSGEMPYKDQVLEINQLRFKVTSVSKKRIEQIKVSI